MGAAAARPVISACAPAAVTPQSGRNTVCELRTADRGLVLSAQYRSGCTIMYMSRARRRAARQAKRERIDAAYARSRARQDETALGMRKGPRTFTRKDRQVVSVLGGGKKQRYKHLGRKLARRDARNQREWAAMLEVLTGLIEAEAPARPVRIAFAGSCVPYAAFGQAVTREGSVHAWHLRYRYDRAFLEVGVPDPDDDCHVDEAVLTASRDDVSGDPCRGWLSTDDATRLIAELFNELTPRTPGTRFIERLANTVELARGGGNPDAPHLIRAVTT